MGVRVIYTLVLLSVFAQTTAAQLVKPSILLWHDSTETDTFVATNTSTLTNAYATDEEKFVESNLRKESEDVKEETMSVFSFNGFRWRFCRIKKTTTILMYSTDSDGRTIRRQIVMNKNDWKELFDKGLNIGPVASNTVFFTGNAKDFTSAMIYSICISPGFNYLAVYRNRPGRGLSEIKSTKIFRFSTLDTTAYSVATTENFFSMPSSNLVQQDSLLIRSLLTERSLTLLIYSTNNLNKIKKKIILVAGDSISNRIVVRKSVSRILYTRDLKKDYKNPYSRFINAFGAGFVSSFAFVDSRGDIVFGLTRFIQERSTVGGMGGPSVSYRSGEKYFTLSLRLNPITLELYDDPNGAVAQEEE